MPETPLTDAIVALTTYANTITGESDTTLSDAVDTLAAGYGQGGDNLSQIMLVLGKQAFYQLQLPEKVIFPSVTNAEEKALNGVTGCKIMVLPAISTIGQYIVADSTSYETIDLGVNTPGIQQWLFSNDTNLSTVIIRSAAVATLQNISAFNNTPFASGKSGGTLYVPSALISSYQSASVWSTILGYPNNSIQAIEGSQYESYYADGTPIT